MRRASFERRIGARPRAGITLVELLVVIVALGAMSTVVGLTWRSGLGEIQTEEDEGVAAVVSMRAQALSSGKAVTRTIHADGRTLVVTVLPDGRVIGAGALGIHPLSGQR